MIRHLHGCLAILILTACAPALGSGSAESPQALTREQLVMNLGTEGPMAERARLESTITSAYDVIVAEILRRRDPEIIPLLLERINDDAPVMLPEHSIHAVCLYDTPVRVKYKVRFILSRLLDPADYQAIVPDATAANVDQSAARRYYELNRETIARRMTPP